jgi:hypothetical protein
MTVVIFIISFQKWIFRNGQPVHYDDRRNHDSL